jgi:hypothetical protein
MTVRTPGELARETLKLLASRRIAPTPENYVLVYAEISGTSAAPVLPAAPSTAAGEPDATDWSQVIRDLMRQLELRHAGVSLTQKRDGLERLLISFRRSPQLGDKLAALTKAWGEALSSAPGALLVDAAEAAGTPEATDGAAAPAPAAWRDAPVFNGIAAMKGPAAGVTLLPIVEDLAHTLRELLAAVFERELAPRVSDYPRLAGTVSRLPPLVRAATLHARLLLRADHTLPSTRLRCERHLPWPRWTAHASTQVVDTRLVDGVGAPAVERYGRARAHRYRPGT